MKKIKFSKLHGQGNDFIIVDATMSSLPDFKITEEQIAKMCDRHFGIGADGLILVRDNAADSDFFMDYYNQDGTIAEMCGNGIRCMARFIHDKKLSSGSILKILTRAGIKKVEILGDEIKVDMGKPIFEPSGIPVNIGPQNLINGYFAGNYNLATKNGIFEINCVSMGNPHCVIFLKKNQDIDNIPIEKWGPEIENNRIFPKKTNVEFIKIINESTLKMRVWERGVGETLACGTGACASAVCAAVLKKVATGNVTVNLPGGKLKIIWEGIENSVYLEGTTENVFEGEYTLR